MQLKTIVYSAAAVLHVLLLPGVVAQLAATPPPAPALEWLLTYEVDFGLPLDAGDTPGGRRVLWPVRNGKFNGPKLNGVLFSIGGDWSLTINGTMYLDVRYQFLAADGSQIYVSGRGSAMENGELHGQLRFETGSSKYYWMNKANGIAIGNSRIDLTGAHIKVDIFTVKGEQPQT